MKSPKAKSRNQYVQLLNKVEKWVNTNMPELESDIKRHHTYNFFMTILGLRPAFLVGKDRKVKSFSKDFDVVAKVGPYFDIKGKDWVYVVNKKYAKKFEPLFQKLENSYVDSEKLLEKRVKYRSKIIGEILGFGQCIGSGQGPTTYGIEVFVSPKDFSFEQEVYSFLCETPKIHSTLEAMTQLITDAKQYFDPCGLRLGFKVQYPWP